MEEVDEHVSLFVAECYPDVDPFGWVKGVDRDLLCALSGLKGTSVDLVVIRGVLGHVLLEVG